MSIYNQISILVFLLIFFGIYKLFKKKKIPLSPELNIFEEDLKLYLQDLQIRDEKRVRKQWLISFWLYNGMSATLFLLTFIGQGLFTDFAENTGNAFSFLVGLGISFFGLIPWVFVTYHCSYKKKGLPG